MYRQCRDTNMVSGESVPGDILPNVVQRISDGAAIPANPNNKDWRDYQAWLALGNTPESPL